MTREGQQDLPEQAIRYIYDEDNPEAGLQCLQRAAEAGLPEAMRIRSQAFYDTMSRLITCLFLMGAGHKLGEYFDHPYAAYIGMGIGLVLAACLCKYISYSRLMQLGQNKES